MNAETSTSSPYPKSLFHYTSVDTLLLILSNKTLRFNNLSSTDDPEEAEASDVYLPGRFCYVSCWTDDPAESIPMWSMYGGPKLDGVRVELPPFPFVEYYIPADQSDNKDPISTYIDLMGRDTADLPYISADMPILFEVDYTNQEELLKPMIKSEKSDGSSHELTMDVSYVGAFKRKAWSFQKEWRYKLFAAPYRPSEIRTPSTAKQIALLRRFEDDGYFPVERFIDLRLSDDSLSKMRILLGPNVTKEQESQIKRAVDSCSGGIQIERSHIRYRR